MVPWSIFADKFRVFISSFSLTTKLQHMRRLLSYPCFPRVVRQAYYTLEFTPGFQQIKVQSSCLLDAFLHKQLNAGMPLFQIIMPWRCSKQSINLAWNPLSRHSSCMVTYHWLLMLIRCSVTSIGLPPLVLTSTYGCRAPDSAWTVISRYRK